MRLSDGFHPDTLPVKPNTRIRSLGLCPGGRARRAALWFIPGKTVRIFAHPAVALNIPPHSRGLSVSGIALIYRLRKSAPLGGQPAVYGVTRYP